MTDHTYKAAAWFSNDGQTEVVLTREDQAGLPDAELLTTARRELSEQGGSEDGGEIRITMWYD